MFAAGFFLSLIFYRSAAEGENEQKHASLDKAITEVDNTQQTLKNELKESPEKVATQKQECRIVFYYLEQSIAECKSIVNSAVAEYKKSYAQQRGTVPDFFGAPVVINYDESVSN